MIQLLMPKATAVWLVDNTALSFDQIAEFCRTTFGVDFPMTAKVDVKGEEFVFE